VEGERGPYPSEPLVLLVDEGSASGSELLAGCLQDWDRAVLVGAPTFGKGFVQNLFPLRERSSLRLTIGQYHTPSGRTFYRPDSMAAPDTGRYTSLVYGRAVIGGGQIFPDIEASDLRCPVYLHAFLRRQGPFDFTVKLLERDSLPALDYDLAAHFWESRHAQFESELQQQLEEIAPVELHRSARWQRTITDLVRQERAFDLQSTADCILYVISRHLVRAGRRVPLLDEPLLFTDPALAEAVSILRSPDRYQAILTGQGQDRGAELSGST
jgi:carboxyl-terminal processing protease